MAVLSADPSRPQLSRFYVHTMRSVSKRLVLRMDPSVKRMVCKSCDSLLVSGVTATHRIRARRERHLVVKCQTCGRLKRFLARPNHQLWSDKPTNVVDQSGTTGEPSTADQSLPKPTKCAPESNTERPKSSTGEPPLLNPPVNQALKDKPTTTED